MDEFDTRAGRSKQVSARTRSSGEVFVAQRVVGYLVDRWSVIDVDLCRYHRHTGGGQDVQPGTDPQAGKEEVTSIHPKL